MKRILLTLLTALLLALVLLGWTFTPKKLDLSLADPSWDEPQADPPEGMRLAVLATGQMLSQQVFSFRGGAVGQEQISGMDAVLIEHPGGRFLLDTGFGRDVDEHTRTIPPLMRWLSTYEKDTPAADRLREAGYPLEELDGILLSHVHWDHVSGIPDFPGVPVWVNQAERDYVENGGEVTTLARGFTDVEYKVYDFDGPPYLGFGRSHDLFGDGSVVVVPAGGHTPGSVVTFVTLPSGRRYAFVGDLVWAREGIELPAERPWLARRLVDLDAAVVRRNVVHLHRIAERIPDMVFVPAHDRRVFEQMAAFPDFEGSSTSTATQDGPLVVFLGDSLTAGFGLTEDQAFPARVAEILAAEGSPVRVVNAGVSGDTTAGGVARLAWLLRQEPDVVVVSLGGNDGLRALDVSMSERNLRQIVEESRAAGARVLLTGMLVPPNYGPDYAERFAAVYPRLAEETGVALLPFLLEGVAAVPELNQADGIHPNALGQGRVAELVASHLRPLVATAAPSP